LADDSINTYIHMNIHTYTYTYSVLFVELHPSNKATRRQSYNTWAALATGFYDFI